MSREEPYFRKCCFCIPLKTCLQTWACVKSIADISIAVFFMLVIILVHNSSHRSSLDHFSIVLIILAVLLAIDSIFMVVLSVGLWTNNLKGLRVFYFYSIYMVVTGAIFVIGMTIYSFILLELYRYDEILFTVLIVCGIINIALDVCIIFTLKSEIIKMRNKQQYEFMKLPPLNTEDGVVTEPGEPFQIDEENLNVYT